MAPASVIQLALLDAIDSNDVDGLESLLKDKTRLTDVLNAHIDDDNGVTLLHRACKVTSPGLVSALLRAGALFDTIDKLGRSALMLALGNETVDLDEQAEVVDMLLAKKANVLKSDYSARSVLHYACRGGNAECLQLLLDKGIDVDTRDSQGRTPLHVAIEEGELDCAKVLIANGADKKAQDKQGLDPVHSAGSADAVNLLLGIPVPADSQVPHSKREAAKRQALLTEGSANSTSKDSKPQLVATGSNSTSDGMGSPRTVDGTSPSRGTSNNELQSPRHPHRTPDQMTEVLQTQLVLAVRSQDTDKVAMLLIDHEDELDTTQSHLPEAWTPLHEAVLIQARDCVEVLLDHGFSVHAETIAGVTPLPLACSKGDYDLTILLLERGARVDATDRQGLRPLLLAASIPPSGPGGVATSSGRGTPHKKRKGPKAGTGNQRAQSEFISRGADIVKELLNRGAQPNHVDVNQWNALHHACHSGNPEAVDYLLARDPNTAVQRTKDGETPLHRACLSGSRECVELLLEQGTPIDAVDVDQQAPLHVAVQGGHYDCVHSLLEYAADPNIEDRESQTPLLLAVMFNHVECAKALIDAGADVFCTDRRGYTLLDHAYENGSEQLFHILTRAGATSDGKLGYDEKLTKEEFVAAKMGGSARSRPPERHTVVGVDFIADTGDATSRTSKGSKTKRKPRMESQQKISSVYGSSTTYKEWHPVGPEPHTARRRPLTSARGRRSRPGTAPQSIGTAPRRRPSTGASSRRPGTGTENGAGASGNTSRPKTAMGQPSVVKRPHEFSWENFSYVRDKRENMQLQRMMETCHCSGNRWMPSVNCVCQARKEESRKLEREVQEKADTLLAKLEKYLGPDAARRRMQSPGPKNVSREARATHRARQRRPVTASAAHERKMPKELVASPYSGGRGVFELDDELPFMITGSRGCRCGRALKFKNSTCVRCLLEDVPPVENGASDSDSRGHSGRPPPTRAEIKWTHSSSGHQRAKSARVANGHKARDRSQSRSRQQRPLPRTKSSNTLTRTSDPQPGYQASSPRSASPRDFDDGSNASHRVPRPASQQSQRAPPPQRPAGSRSRRPMSSTGQVRRVASGGSVVNGVHFMPSAPSSDPPPRARHQRRPQTAGAM